MHPNSRPPRRKAGVHLVILFVENNFGHGEPLLSVLRIVESLPKLNLPALQAYFSKNTG
jgi:hypothetical protein